MTSSLALLIRFFFLMIRRPPRSTRLTHSFPTRRSSDLAIPGIAVAPRIARQRERGTALRRRCLGLLQKLDPAREPRLIPNLPLLNPAIVDRKSTRLNSSH